MMIRMMIRILGCALLLTFATALPASADQSWKQSSAVWQQMDKCTAAALKANPDYTREGNAKREAARQKCLRNGNLPSDVSAAPAAPATTEAKQPQ